MALYKDQNNNVHDDMNGTALHLLPLGCIPITDEEAAILTATPAPPPQTQFSSLAFLDRFTQAEQLSVVQATMISAEVKLWYDRLLAADFVDLEDPRTEAGVDALIMAGLLDPSRKLEILTP